MPTSETPAITLATIQQLIANGFAAVLEAQAATVVQREQLTLFAGLSGLNQYFLIATVSRKTKLLTNKYCPRTEVKNNGRRNLQTGWKEIDLKTYIRRILRIKPYLCPTMVPNTEKLMEVFINGLPRSIEGNVTASKPQTLEEAINKPNRLMSQDNIA
ncbi:hypothetical protein Tco_0657173 [Tanacetum coccineum]|uniref:Uncharacterized protein n=1 Tax=Tanacetum coccineum TaxID=301880 RepID=A0ABQ4XAU2_9ASTR